MRKKRFLCLIVFALVVAAFSLPATAADAWRDAYTAALSELKQHEPGHAMVDLNGALMLGRESFSFDKRHQRKIRKLMAKAYGASSYPKEMQAANLALLREDYVYGLFKLRQAWLSVADPTLSDARYVEVSRQAGASYSKLNLIMKEPFEQGNVKLADANLLCRCQDGLTSLADWKVQLDADKNLHFTGSLPHFAVGDTEHLPLENQLAIADADRSRRLQEARLPLVITPSSKHYAELLTLSAPIRPGKSKPVQFDLNPFIPKDFQLAMP